MSAPEAALSIEPEPMPDFGISNHVHGQILIGKAPVLHNHMKVFAMFFIKKPNNYQMKEGNCPVWLHSRVA